MRTVLVVAALVVFATLVTEITRGAHSLALTRYAGERLTVLAAYLDAPHMLDGGRLYLFALAGGLVTSVSPCILGMLPVNLAYVGSAGLRSRAQAIRLATTFVAGVIAVNVVLGLASALFFAVFIEYRGHVNVVVGVLTVIAALWMSGVLRMPIPSFVRSIPVQAGPFAVGAALGLATSPCSSPVLFAILAAASKEGNLARAVGAMTVYSVGYTALLWLASVFAGIVVASRRLLQHGVLITRLSAFALGAFGIGTAIYGIALLM